MTTPNPPSAPETEAPPAPAATARTTVARRASLLVLVAVAVLSMSGCYGALGTIKSQGVIASEAAVSQVGVPYVYGASSPGRGFDCSGLTTWAWRQAGYQLPRTSASQYSFTVRISREDLTPGDLVFYGRGGVSHVVMYIGNGNIVHAPGSGRSVKVEPLASYWTSALIGYGRVPGSAYVG